MRRSVGGNPHLARLAAAVCVLLLGCIPTSEARAQLKLLPGILTSVSGSSAAGSYAVVGGIASGLSNSRSSRANRDIIGDFVGGAYSSQAQLTFSVTGGQYGALAFPLTVVDSSVGAVFDELGAVNNTNWRMFSWTATDSSYLELGTANALDVGRGYYIVTAGSGTLTATGLPAPAEPYFIPLSHKTGDRPGWNFIGNPFLYPVAVADLFVLQGGLPIPLTSLLNVVTERTVKGLIPGTTSYTDVTVMNGRTGYWVRKLTNAANVYVIVPNRSSSTGSPAPHLTKPEGADWAVTVSARQGERTAEPVFMGAAPVKAGEWNALNFGRAPDLPGAHVSLYLPKPDWGRMSGDYVREFQPQAETMTWEFVAQAAEVPGEVALDFSAFDLPAGETLWLTDLKDGWTREVRAGQSLTFPAAADGRRFRLVATSIGGQQAATPAVNALRYAYPNPFGASSGLAFALAQPGRIVVAIYDVQGRRVQQLERQGLSAGEHVVVWDGRDADGKTAPAGVYMARYQVGDKQGTARLVKLQ